MGREWPRPIVIMTFDEASGGNKSAGHSHVAGEGESGLIPGRGSQHCCCPKEGQGL